MANTTPIVTTVTKTATKEKTPSGAEAASRVNILDFSEEHYEDILPVMDKIRRDKRKEVHTRLDFGENSRKVIEGKVHSNDLATLTRLARLIPGRTGNTLEMVPTVEVVLTNGTLLLAETVLEAETAHMASKNRMVIPTPLTEQGKNIGTARIWFDELFPESIDGYKDLKAAFLAYFMQQRKYVKDPVEIHNIKQKEGETIEDFMERFKTVEEMMIATAAFIRIETDVASKKKVHTPWKSQDHSQRQNSKRKSDFKNQPRDGRGSNKFTPLTRTPKEIFAAESGKFKPPPPITPVEKRSNNKFCEFHNDKGHSTDECVQLRKQIEELVRAVKLSHFTKETRRDRDQQKTRKKDAPVKDKAAAIYIIQPWQRVTRHKVTQSFAHIKEIMFPSLAANKGTGCPLVIEAEISGRIVHRIYVDIGSSMEVLYEHCFNRIHPEIKSQRVPATTSLTGFSGETIWPLGQLRLLVTIGDAEHYTRAWMNFMIVRSPSPDNGIIRRPGIKEIQAVPSTAYEMLKFPVNGGIVTICSTILTPTECTTIAATPKDHVKKAEALHENFKTEKRGQAPERAKAIQVEVQKLVEAGILREVYYHDWLSNPVMVKKHDDSWRIFIFESTEKSLPLFKTLKKYIKKSDFHWTPDAEQSFKQLKQHLARLPMLVAPKPKEELIMYLYASYGAISAVLMTERDTVQTPVYFVSRSLQAPELNYTPNGKASPGASQILADFLVEKPNDAPPKASVIKTPQEPWILFTNRSSCVDGSEYEALIAGLRIAAQMGVHNVHVSVDSKLVANQVLGTYVAKEENIVKYLEKSKSMISGFANFSISQVPRSKNKKANALSKTASTSFAHLSKQVLVKVLKEKSIQEEEVATVVEEEGPTWMTPIMEYLKDGTLPGDRKEASKLRIKARQYELWEGVLYRRSFLKLWLRKGQVIDSRYGLFHKVDRDESRGNNHRQSGEEVRVGQHSMPLRSPRKNSLEQRHADTPFSLTNGTEAVIPAEIKMPTYRTAVVDAVYNNEELRLNLDLLEERRECTAICEAKEKSKMTKYYNTKVCGITFRPGDFVYRSNEASHAMDGGKLSPKWEGPYEVTEALGDRAYRLQSTDGVVLPRT
nr:hypothetical protein [Tanacetum cinerariifolium]